MVIGSLESLPKSGKTSPVENPRKIRAKREIPRHY